MSTEDARRGFTRLLAGSGAAWGLALVTRPRRVVAALCPEFPASRLWIVRLLGARLVVQHALVALAPEAAVVRIATAVDLLHAASMVPLLPPRYRRAALISGGISAAYAAVAPSVSPARSAGRGTS